MDELKIQVEAPADVAFVLGKMTEYADARLAQRPMDEADRARLRALLGLRMDQVHRMMAGNIQAGGLDYNVPDATSGPTRLEHAPLDSGLAEEAASAEARLLHTLEQLVSLRQIMPSKLVEAHAKASLQLAASDADAETLLATRLGKEAYPCQASMAEIPVLSEGSHLELSQSFAAIASLERQLPALTGKLGRARTILVDEGAKLTSHRAESGPGSAVDSTTCLEGDASLLSAADVSGLEQQLQVGKENRLRTQIDRTQAVLAKLGPVQ